MRQTCLNCGTDSEGDTCPICHKYDDSDYVMDDSKSPRVIALETELAEARAEIERLKAAGSIEAILAVVEPYYAAKCNHCGWVGSSEACIDNRGCDDFETFCPVCLRHISDEEPTEKDISNFLNSSAIKAANAKHELIEQMREALFKLVGTLEVMSVMPETIGKYPVLAMDAPELEQARAALEAAERSE